MSEGQEFLKECKEVRNDFVEIAGQYTVGEHLKLRTEIDTLLIMYDQLCELVRLADSSNENSGLHKHFVTNRTYKCSRCGTEYIPASGTVKAGCCIMPVDHRTSGICGGELIEVI